MIRTVPDLVAALPEPWQRRAAASLFGVVFRRAVVSQLSCEKHVQV
jgi:hypothetical protein